MSEAAESLHRLLSEAETEGGWCARFLAWFRP